MPEESLRITRQTNRLGNLLPLPEFLSPCRPVWIRRRESLGTGGEGGERPAQRRWTNEGLPQIRWFWQFARFYYAHMGHYLSQWSAWTSKNVAKKSCLNHYWLVGIVFFLKRMQCSTGILHLHVIQPWFFTLLFRSNLLVTSQVVRLWYSKSW